MQEFDHLYLSYCCQPQTFNQFTTYLKNSKLFLNMRGPLNLQNFRQLMMDQDNILVNSSMIRHEYTYFVCFQMLPDHNDYFNRSTFMSRASDATYRQTIIQGNIGMDAQSALSISYDK